MDKKPDKYDEAQIIENYEDYLYTLAGASVSSETDMCRDRFRQALAALRARPSAPAADEPGPYPLCTRIAAECHAHNGRYCMNAVQCQPLGLSASEWPAARPSAHGEDDEIWQKIQREFYEASPDFAGDIGTQKANELVKKIIARVCQWELVRGARLASAAEDVARSEQHARNKFADAMYFKARAEKAEAALASADASARDLREAARKLLPWAEMLRDGYSIHESQMLDIIGDIDEASAALERSKEGR